MCAKKAERRLADDATERMGYALLFESMLPSVVDARDRFMKPGGLVLPVKAPTSIR